MQETLEIVCIMQALLSDMILFFPVSLVILNNDVYWNCLNF